MFEIKGQTARLNFSALIAALRDQGIPCPQGVREPAGAPVVTQAQWREAFARRAPNREGDTSEKHTERVNTAMQRAVADFPNWRLIGARTPFVRLTGRPVRDFNLYTLTTAQGGDTTAPVPLDEPLGFWSGNRLIASGRPLSFLVFPHFRTPTGVHLAEKCLSYAFPRRCGSKAALGAGCSPLISGEGWTGIPLTVFTDRARV